MSKLTKTGVYGGAGSFGRYQWNCACGAKAETSCDDREKAREGLKEHNKKCPLKKRHPQPEQEAAVAKAKKVEAPTAAAEVPAAASKKPKTERKKRQAGVTPEQAKAALAKIEAGSSTLFTESKALGFTHNGPLRAALRQMIGTEKYNELMSGRRGRQKKEKSAEKKAAPAKAVKAVKKPTQAAPPTQDATPAGEPA